MSLLQEIHGGNVSMMAALSTNNKNAEELAASFYEKTGLDLSDCLYREENRAQLEEYIKTGKLPQNPRGFDYTDLIKNGCFCYNSRQWLKAHYNGGKPIIELELAGYIAYCKGIGSSPKKYSNLKYFLAHIKAA